MKFPQPIPVRALAARFQAQLIGDESLEATGINEIHKVEPGDIAFSDAPKYFQKTLDSAATVILLNAAAACPPGKAILIVEQPFQVYDALVREHRPFQPLSSPISYRAEVHPTAIIEPGVVLAPHVRIGAHCYIQANAYIGEHTHIGDHVNIGPGAIIGSDAFYFKKHPDGSFQKWRSGGRVIIHDHVDIGAGCTINKGVSGDTVIGEGSKLDCLIHIGHGAVIGRNCLFAAQVGIGGKTVVGDNVVLYGQVGIAQALHIGDGAVVLAKSGVSKSLEGGKTYFGTPADEMRDKYKELAALRQLPDLLKKLRR
ncbi:MAG TPA: UDP-3-O-(3-hydroxymyristoyl)glucosamine N-acyltransferase [Saprospiraceae bacterium]|nr:UDP-3-O-(3-hydroxymyristoyl)glucosamine N-acyltransferase [Saprospiraceae bacterium]HND89975.1 UDP-3-O-(3-hydroxymyristoyl)glucosamine N-acyltransferase [Saprospiraceae bacterium]HNG90514.1 UDP-3-O-(3-hydroxymyristoyl)glucosamine N-acyltransferase [Saprospiraceae bacterium]